MEKRLYGITPIPKRHPLASPLIEATAGVAEAVGKIGYGLVESAKSAPRVIGDGIEAIVTGAKKLDLAAGSAYDAMRKINPTEEAGNLARATGKAIKNQYTGSGLVELARIGFYTALFYGAFG